MQFKKSQILAACLTAAAIAPAMAQTTPIIGYWLDSSGRIVHNTWGECWHTGSWTPALAIPECDAVAKPFEVKAAPMPAPAPEPAPVIATAPAPAPVAAPAPSPAPAPAPAPVLKTVRLDGANFATGSSKLLPGADKRLDEVVNAAQQNPSTGLTVTGYTDSTGKVDANVKLSQARAEAVKAYLVGKGVAASRITTEGKGPANPIGDNLTTQGRAENRRVEVSYTTQQ